MKDKKAQEIIIGSLNLCLGLPNKKDSVIEILKNDNVSICCLQEVEPESSLPVEIQTWP